MSQKDIVLNFLQEHPALICDDCLSEMTNVVPRQTIFQLCTKLHNQGLIERDKSECSVCGKFKKASKATNIDPSQVSQRLTEARPQKLQIKPRQPRRSYIDQSTDLDRFVNVPLVFEEFDIKNVFAKLDPYTLDEVLKKDKYAKFIETVYARYPQYLNMKLGQFLFMLKDQGDNYYRQFLNAYGDHVFCKFRMADNPFFERKGLYLYKSDDQIKYVGRVKGENNFHLRINTGYAYISPKNCYVDGQSTSCHINAIINSLRGNIELFILPLENDEEIIRTERWLINLIQPEWNISLK